jgi:hypothetical protein
MRIATANDLVISTEWLPGASAHGLPGIEHAQVLSTEGAQKAAFVVTLKQTRLGGTAADTLTLEVDLEGSNDLANWRRVLTTGTDVEFPSLADGSKGTDDKSGIALEGWAWVRLRYRLRSTTNNYGAVTSSVLVTSTLSVGG